MTTPLPKLQPPRVTQGVDPMNTKASNLPLEWKNWLMKFNIYLKAYSLDKEPDDRQVAILLHFMGQDCLTIFNSFNLDVNTVKLEELTKKFTHYFSPKVNITMERHKLFNRKQTLHEDLDNYVTDLRNIALQCNFGNPHDKKEEIGDRRPPSFLRHLKALARTAFPECLLRTIWLGRLPTQIQAILIAQTASNLEDLGELADKLYEVATNSSTCRAITASPVPQVAVTSVSPAADSARFSQMEKQICDLTNVVAQLTAAFNNRRERSRSRSKSRNRWN
ncbi:hypothetical protein ACJJTC_013840 [Scirpophaga incertulas]